MTIRNKIGQINYCSLKGVGVCAPTNVTEITNRLPVGDPMSRLADSLAVSFQLHRSNDITPNLAEVKPKSESSPGCQGGSCFSFLMLRISTQFALFQESELSLAEGPAAFASCHVICRDVF